MIGYNKGAILSYYDTMRYLYLLLLLIVSNVCFATACSTAYPDGLQTHGNNQNHKIKFSCGAQLINGISEILATKGINNPSGGCALTCSSGNCLTSGTPVNIIDMGAYQTTTATNDIGVGTGGSYTLGATGVTEFDNIDAQNGATINFTAAVTGSTTYHIDRLRLYKNSTINFLPGDYWIKNFKVEGNNVSVNVIGNGTVRVFTKNNMSINKSIAWNVGGNAKNFWLYGYGNVEFKHSNTDIVAVLYSQKKVLLNQNVTLIGAITARNIDLKNNTKITYDGAAVAALDFGSVCVDPNSASYFTVNHNNNGIHCIPHQVTVTAMSDNGTVIDYNKTIVLDTGTGAGIWSKITGNGDFDNALPLDDGIASYTFAVTDGGEASFALEYQQGTPIVTIAVYQQDDTGINNSATAGDIVFSPSDFLVDVQNHIAGISTNVTITAYGQTATHSACGVIESYTGSKPLQFWYDYINPNFGTIDLSVDNVTIGESETNAVTVNTLFTNGVATVPLNYRDVGKVQLHLKDELVLEPINGIRGSSEEYVVKPAKFIIDVPNIVAATDATGPVFKSSGEAFTINVSVTDNDNNITPNYGNEDTPENITVTPTIVLPNTGSDGNINNINFSKINPGQFSCVTCNFDEVGIMQLTASVASGDYLAAGNISGPTTGNIGRFIPYEFTIAENEPLLLAANNSSLNNFSYIKQQFTYSLTDEAVVTVHAREKNGAITSNYSGDFYKLDKQTPFAALDFSYSMQAIDNVSLEYPGVSAIAFADNNNGTGTYTFGSGDNGFKVSNLGNANIEPFLLLPSLHLTIKDSDNVGYNTVDNLYSKQIDFLSDDNQFYHGRLAIGNAHGPEILPLELPFTIEYFKSGDYVTNIYDSSSAISVESPFLEIDPSIAISETGNITFTGGEEVINFIAPNVAGSVEVKARLDLADLEYLQYNGENPMGQATFGIAKGRDAIIFSQERY